MAHSFGQDYQIIVVGGGIAGLATALSLAPVPWRW
jgi:2-polyprenyl-6-methoxyphenol hydroxylase-like FAD-dependent oxidoreductase